MEAGDFTPWLAQNLDLVSELLGLRLVSAETEVSVGSFQLDILAETESGNKVVIENQLEPTDHDHLGKLLTYLVNLEAKTAVWISRAPRVEHIETIKWLNNVTPPDVRIYLLSLRVCRIGDSLPAPILTLEAGPVQEIKRLVRDTSEMKERHSLRIEFWQGLLERGQGKSKLHSRVNPRMDNWISMSAGRAGLSFQYVIRMNDASVFLVIDLGPGRDAETKRYFDILHSKAQEIEGIFGRPLDWARGEGKRVATIGCTINQGGLSDRDTWPALQDAMFDAMVRLEKGLRGPIEGLPK